jgi:hypothetical protein
MSDLPEDEDAEWPLFHSLGFREGRIIDESQVEPPWLQYSLTRDDGSYVDESDDDYEYWRKEELEYDSFFEMLEADRELISLLKSHQWEEVYLKNLDSQSADEQQQVPQRLHLAEIRRFLSPLSENEKNFLKILYGLDTGTTRTTHETAELYDITPELVIQIEKNALDKLRYATELPLPTTEAQQLPNVDPISPNVSQVIGLLERLSLLSSAGHITREEFETLKARVMHEYK